MTNGPATGGGLRIVDHHPVVVAEPAEACLWPPEPLPEEETPLDLLPGIGRLPLGA